MPSSFVLKKIWLLLDFVDAFSATTAATTMPCQNILARRSAAAELALKNQMVPPATLNQTLAKKNL